MAHSIKILPIVLFIVALFPFRFAEADAAAKAAALPVKTIAIAPILPVETFSIENRGGALDLFAGVGLLIKKSIENDRINELKEMFVTQSFSFQKEIALAALSELRKNGEDATFGNDIQYEKDEPDEIDYKNSKTDSDHILSLTVSDVGLYSNRLSTKFFPRLTIKFELVNKKTEESVYSQSIYYGADANATEEDEVLASPKFSYTSFEDAMARQSELIEAYREGINKISHLAAMQIKSLY